jgi:cell division protein FtsB
MRVRIVSLLVIAIGSLISFGLAKNLNTAYQNSKILSDEHGKLMELRNQNSRLKGEVSEASNPSYVDNEARKKLGLVRPGEVEVIISHAPSVTASSPAQPQSTKMLESANNKSEAIWKEWLKLILGG